MNNFLKPRHQGWHGGFTLVELLTVIAIVSVLMTAGAIGINRLAGSQGVGSAVSQTEALFHFARQSAVANNTNTRVLIAKSMGSGGARHPDDLRRILVAVRDPGETETWSLSDRGEFLPPNVYFSQQFSQTSGGTAIPSDTIAGLPAAFNGQFFYYEFNSEGIAVDAGAGFVVGTGVWPPNETTPRVSRKDERDFGGFVVWRNGRTSLYRSPEQIPGMPATVTNF